MTHDTVVARASVAAQHAPDFARVFVAYTEALQREGVPIPDSRDAAWKVACTAVLAGLPQDEWEL